MKKYKRLLALSLAVLMLMSTFITFPATAVTTTSEPVSADTTAESVSAESTAEPVSAEKQTLGTLLADFNFDDENNWQDGGNAVATEYENKPIDFVEHDGGRAAVFSTNDTITNALEITKNDSEKTPLLTGYDNLRFSFDFKRTGNNWNNWPFFVAKDDSQYGTDSVMNYISCNIRGETYYDYTDEQGVKYYKPGRVEISRNKDNVGYGGFNYNKLEKDQWYHIDVIFTGSKNILYVDNEWVGAGQAPTSIAGILGDSSIFRIGYSHYWSEFSAMQLDNFKVYGYDSDVQAMADIITLPYSTDPGEEIYGDITLPSSVEVWGGITWSSGDTSVITDDGKVTRPTTDTKVKLTATYTENDVSADKEIWVTVKGQSKQISEDDYTDYFFAYFTGEQSSDGEQVYFATSRDGMYWQNINNNNPSLISNVGRAGLRDPFIIRSKEGDKFYLLATDANHYKYGWDTFSTSIFIAESTDLINWTNQRLVDLNKRPDGLNNGFKCAWAPEAFYDSTIGKYVVFWASSYDENPANETATLEIFRATTSDFRSFSDFAHYKANTSGTYSFIDTTMIQGSDGIYRFTKNEKTSTQTIGGIEVPPKSVFVEKGSSVLSNDFEMVSTTGLSDYSSNSGIPVEGPAVFKLNKDDARTDTWCLLLDNFSSGGYFPLLSNDLTNFKKVNSGEYSMPGTGSDIKKARHGTPIRITTAEYNKIMAAAEENTNTHAEFDVDAVNVLDNDANTILIYPNMFAKDNLGSSINDLTDSNHICNLGQMFPTLPDDFQWSDWTAVRFEKRGDEAGGLRYSVLQKGTAATDFGVQKNDSFLLLVKTDGNEGLLNNIKDQWPTNNSGVMTDFVSDGCGDTAEIFINNNLYINDINNNYDGFVEHKYVEGKSYGTVTFLPRNTFGVEAVNTLADHAKVNTILVYPKYFDEIIRQAEGNADAKYKILRYMFPTDSLPDGFHWKDWTAFRIEQRGADDNIRYTVLEEGSPVGSTSIDGYIGVDKYESYILLVKNTYLSQNNILLPTADWPSGDTNTDGNGDTATFTFLNSGTYTSVVNETLINSSQGYATVDSNTKYYGYVTFTPKDYEQRNGINGEMGEKATDTTPVSDPSIKFSLFDYDGEINYKPGTTDYTTDNQRPIANFFPFKSQPYDVSNWNPAYHNINFSNGVWGIWNETPFDKWSYKQGHTTVNKTLDKPLNSDGYPVLNLMNGYDESTQTTVSDTSLTDEQRSLAYLFGGTNDSSVTKYTPKNTLLQKVSTHYTYDCNNNAVDYDTSENVFRLRNYTERIKATATGDQTQNCDFLPFNYTDGVIIGTDQRNNNFPYAGESYTYNLNTQNTNYWFGMRMDVDFIQGKDGKNENEEMVFKFSGDDDVWVFIDDVLVLDLGGIHGACTGTINFNTGAIEQYEQQFNKEKNSYPTTLKECFEAAGKVNEVNWNSYGTTFADYTEHTMSFFYMERGSGASYCNIDFNLPTAPDKSVAVSKDVVDSNGKNLNASDSTNYYFKITDAGDGTAPTGEEANYTIGTDTKSVDESGQFTLQGGQTAYFTNLASENEYKIEEITEGQSYYNYLKSTAVSVDDGAKITATSTTVTPTDVTQTVKFINTLKSLTVNLKYYGRETVNGKPADIKKEPTTYTKSYIGQEYLDYINSTDESIENDPIGAMILDTGVAFDSASAQQDTKYRNVLDGYEMWISQAQAKAGIASFDNLHQKNENGTYNKYSETDYHTNWYGYTQTVSAGDKTANWDDSTPTDTVSDGEKWVNYYGYTDGNKQVLDESQRNSGTVTEVTIWLFNQPKQYTVEAYEAKSFGDLTEVNGKYVAKAVPPKSVSAYYNQRLGLAIDENAEYSQATDHLAGYGIDSYVGTKLDTAYSVKDSAGNTYKFAYWAFDENGKNVASTDILYNYRIVTNTKLYAVYTTDGTVNNGNPGLTVSENERDIFFNSSGTSITRLNTEMNPYNCQNNDTNIKNVAITYIIPNSTNTEIVETKPVIQAEGVTYVLLSDVQNAIKATLKYVSDENADKNFYSFTYSDETIALEGFKKGNYFVFYVDGHNIPEDELTGVKDISLTNKNRIEFGSDFQTKVLYGDGDQILPKRMYAFAAMYYNGSYTDNSGKINNLDEWIVSDNFIDYDFR